MHDPCLRLSLTSNDSVSQALDADRVHYYVIIQGFDNSGGVDHWGGGGSMLIFDFCKSCNLSYLETALRESRRTAQYSPRGHQLRKRASACGTGAIRCGTCLRQHTSLLTAFGANSTYRDRLSAAKFYNAESGQASPFVSNPRNEPGVSGFLLPVLSPLPLRSP